MVPSNKQETRKRATCDVCETNPEKCKAVTNYFAKKEMLESYHFMYTIPMSACYVTILHENSSENFLALLDRESKKIIA